ncbi:hypothetical protein J3F83DRAFT_594612 [Trichoderma novae-zelandiae]
MPILSPRDKEALASQGLLSPASSEGTIRIHKRRLNRSSDEENAHLPLPPSPASSTSLMALLDAFSTIPEELVSLATVKYLGYNDEAATEIWDRWVARFPRGQPISELEPVLSKPFLDPIIGFSYGRRELDVDDDSNDGKWFECMDQCGINQITQTAIMDPVYNRVRLTRSCLYWIRDTIELRYRALKEVQEASRQRDQEIQRAALRPGGSASQQHGATGSQTGHRSISETIRMAPGISRDSAMSKATLRAATNAPGSITLYKGVDTARIRQLFDENGRIKKINVLASPPPTDFCGRDIGFYFTVERDIAVLYSCWAKARSNSSSVVIVHATIQNSTIESLSERELQRVYWPSEEWKRLLFESRNLNKLPSDLRKFKLASLVIGTTASKPNWVYAGMDSHNEITERMVLKTKDGRSVVQYVFRNEDGEDLLAEKADIKVYAMTTKEHETWHQGEAGEENE